MNNRIGLATVHKGEEWFTREHFGYEVGAAPRDELEAWITGEVLNEAMEYWGPGHLRYLGVNPFTGHVFLFVRDNGEPRRNAVPVPVASVPV